MTYQTTMSGMKLSYEYLYDKINWYLMPVWCVFKLVGGTKPRKYTKKTDRVRTPLGVLTRANEAVAQGGNYTRVAKEFSIERMKLKHFIRKKNSRALRLLQVTNSCLV